jgi:hypothetical protein
VSGERTTERNDAHVREDLVDPGPLPDVQLLRAQQKAMRAALAKSEPGPMRK